MAYQSPFAKPKTALPASKPTAKTGYVSPFGTKLPAPKAQVPVTAPTPAIQPVALPPKLPAVSPFFAGGGYGASPTADSEGKPFLTRPQVIPKTYDLPEQTISVQDKKRVATAFDPTKPQKLDRKVLVNGRLPYTASSAIKDELKGAYSDELDHQIALELSGSNDRSNLKLIPGRVEGEAARLNKEMNRISKAVSNGEMSLLDGQREAAKLKGFELPEDKKKSLLTKVRDKVLAITPTKVLEKAALLQEKPLTFVKKASGKVLDYGKDVIKNPKVVARTAANTVTDFGLKVASGVTNIVGADRANEFIKENRQAFNEIADSQLKNQSERNAAAITGFIVEQVPYFLAGAAATNAARGVLGKAVTQYGGKLTPAAISKIGKLAEMAGNVTGFIGLDQLMHQPEDGSRAKSIAQDLVLLGTFEILGAGLASYSGLRSTQRARSFIEKVKVEKPPLPVIEKELQAIKNEIRQETGQSVDDLVATTVKNSSDDQLNAVIASRPVEQVKAPKTGYQSPFSESPKGEVKITAKPAGVAEAKVLPTVEKPKVVEGKGGITVTETKPIPAKPDAKLPESKPAPQPEYKQAEIKSKLELEKSNYIGKPVAVNIPNSAGDITAPMKAKIVSKPVNGKVEVRTTNGKLHTVPVQDVLDPRTNDEILKKIGAQKSDVKLPTVRKAEAPRTVEPPKPEAAKTRTAVSADEAKPRDSASRVYERLKQEHPSELADDVSYDAMTLKKDADTAVELLAKDKDKAYRIAMGAEEGKDVTNTAVNIAMAEKALAEENYTLYNQLTKNRSFAQTRRGQEIVAEKGSVSDNSVAHYVKQVLSDRMDKLGSQYLSGMEKAKLTFKNGESKAKRAMQTIDDEVKKVQSRISRTKALDLDEAQKLIDELSC